ncbi:hypothetical protein L226DRAFT_577631 [Lentinus tigrinus ALCF2SS1-7]|uniref:uncharacterized protein n=1 Tax=Lentinus tigrinus ALCF2SS1-7 TaxID=1328758 RepID=UPI0011662C73|nr:hypothetical protein L226DRAFT_577631 [Lentinus tigrinus ALCF2SS1-7]
MLKRQRSTPSFVPDAYTPMNPAIDTFEERVAKRRRQFAPPHSQSMDKGKTPWRPGDSDGEEDVEIHEYAVRPLAPSEQAQRLQQAGEYKHVNTLLHDLHAEQRHRILFSSTSPPEHIPIAHNHPRNHPEFDHPFSSLDKLAPTYGSLPVSPHESAKHMPTFTISIPSKDASPVDHVEVRRVTERYEDTNRLIGPSKVPRVLVP